jgi:hypothetical protein
MDTTASIDRSVPISTIDERRRTAQRIFRGALIFNAVLTAFWFFVLATHQGFGIFQQYQIDRAAVARVTFGILFFYVVWGFIWYAVKNLLLKFYVGFTKEERRLAFSSRMQAPFDVASFTSRYSERRIRITDMIGRRGRFITLALVGFFYLYAQVSTEQSPRFANGFLTDSLFDAVITSWVFLAIREPSMVLVARLPQLGQVQHWALPSHGAHGIDIDHQAGLLYVACDGGALVQLDTVAGEIRHEWPLAGGPDATFFNPTSGLVHVAIGDPGLVQSIDPRTGTSTQFTTARGAQTTALVAPDQLYVFSPVHRGALTLVEAQQAAASEAV